MPSPDIITQSQLARLLGTPDAPAVLDVRTDEDFARDPRVLPGAIRRDFRSVASWALGLSRIYREDLAQFDAAMCLYDAFYRWARDATTETHNWPAPGGRV